MFDLRKCFVRDGNVSRTAKPCLRGGEFDWEKRESHGCLLDTIFGLMVLAVIVFWIGRTVGFW